MEKSKVFILYVTRRIFSNWTALKMAVDHGMGTANKADQFCCYMRDVMFMNEGISTSEIACELEDYMNEQFNTELQDGSGIQVAEELFRFYRYCVEGKDAEASTEIEKLPPLQLWLSVHVSKRNTNVIVENDSDSESDETDTDMQIEDSEWTEVKTRRKR